MADFYLGEIRAFTCSYATEGWAICDGRSLPVVQYQALYSLLGNMFGGDKTNFNLPDLRGRTMIGYGTAASGTTYNVGDTGGGETETLTLLETPAHNHLFQTGNTPGTGALALGTLAIPQGGTSAAPAAVNIYNTNAATTTTLVGNSIENTGGGAGHPNTQPFTTLNFCIAIQGFYPQRP